MKNIIRNRNKKESMEFYEKHVFPMKILAGKIERVKDKDLNHLGIFFKCVNENNNCFLSTATSWGENGINKDTGEPYKEFTIRFVSDWRFPSMSEYRLLKEARDRRNEVVDKMIHIQVYTNKDEDGVQVGAMVRTVDILKIDDSHWRIFRNPEDNHLSYGVSWAEMKNLGYGVVDI